MIETTIKSLLETVAAYDPAADPQPATILALLAGGKSSDDLAALKASLAPVTEVAFQDAGQNAGAPRIALHVIADALYHTADGGADKTHYGILQVDVVATSYQEARELAEAARQLLDAASNQVGMLQSGDLRDLPTVTLAGADRPEAGLCFDVRFIQTED